MSGLYERVADLVRDEDSAAVLTVLRPDDRLGTRALVTGGRLEGSLGDATADQAGLEVAQRLLREGQSRAVKITAGDGVELEVFVDAYPAPPVLHIFGGVHVGIPLAKFARIVGYRVRVIDPRGVFATPERFADADDLIIQHPEDYLPTAKFNENSAVVVLTHEPRYDEPILKAVLDTPAGYIGAIGSRATNRARVERLQAQGVAVEKLARIHSPIGLDIGSQAPEEIALAIIAEIVASRYGKAGTSLRATAGAFAPA